MKNIYGAVCLILMMQTLLSKDTSRVHRTKIRFAQILGNAQTFLHSSEGKMTVGAFGLTVCTGGVLSLAFLIRKSRNKVNLDETQQSREKVLKVLMERGSTGKATARLIGQFKGTFHHDYRPVFEGFLSKKDIKKRWDRIEIKEYANDDYLKIYFTGVPCAQQDSLLLDLLLLNMKEWPGFYPYSGAHFYFN